MNFFEYLLVGFFWLISIGILLGRISELLPAPMSVDSVNHCDVPISQEAMMASLMKHN